MKKPRQIISRDFLERMRTGGALALAAARLALPYPFPKYDPLPNIGTWELICEEITDTEHRPEYYERVVTELFERGISLDELEQLRLFAWETAGWLNFEKMLWEWVSLDEHDIRRAIDWQFDEREITANEREMQLSYLQRFSTGNHRGAATDAPDTV